MMTPRFYCREPLAPGAQLALPAPVARHAIRALRLSVGDELALFDGRGGEYPARIEYVERERVGVHLGAWSEVERESRLRISLAQALQTGEKMDFTVQKAVELGVAEVIPVESRRSVTRRAGERAAKRVAHWQGVVASACEQCGRNQVPVVAPVTRLDRWLAALPPPGEGCLRLMLAPGATRTLLEMPTAHSVTLLVGAEGGLDEEEMVLARQAGFEAVRLGPRVLRTETAALAAMAAMQAVWGDFSG